MTQATHEEYTRIVILALDAIEVEKRLSPVRPNRNPEVLVAALQEKVAQGVTPTDRELANLHAAIVEKHKPKRRGRPKGRDFLAWCSFHAAAGAVAKSDLRTYRNSATRHRLTQCDAIADAMHGSGFRTLATYDAVAREMVNYRRDLRQRRRFGGAINYEVVEAISRQLEEVSELLAKTLGPVRRQVLEALAEAHRPLHEASRGILQAFEANQRKINESGWASQPLVKRNKADLLYLPNTPERH